MSLIIILSFYVVIHLVALISIYIDVKRVKQLVPAASFDIKDIKRFFFLRYLFIFIVAISAGTYLLFAVVSRACDALYVAEASKSLSLFLSGLPRSCRETHLHFASLAVGIGLPCILCFLCFFNFTLKRYGRFLSKYTDFTGLHTTFYEVVRVFFILISLPLFVFILFGCFLFVSATLVAINGYKWF